VAEDSAGRVHHRPLAEGDEFPVKMVGLDKGIVSHAASNAYQQLSKGLPPGVNPFLVVIQTGLCRQLLRLTLLQYSRLTWYRSINLGCPGDSDLVKSIVDFRS